MIQALDDPYKEVMYLRLTGDLSFKEIGEILEKTENWARVTYYRGKSKVIRSLEDEGRIIVLIVKLFIRYEYLKYICLI